MRCHRYNEEINQIHYCEQRSLLVFIIKLYGIMPQKLSVMFVSKQNLEKIPKYA